MEKVVSFALEAVLPCLPVPGLGVAAITTTAGGGGKPQQCKHTPLATQDWTFLSYLAD